MAISCTYPLRLAALLPSMCYFLASLTSQAVSALTLDTFAVSPFLWPLSSCYRASYRYSGSSPSEHGVS